MLEYQLAGDLRGLVNRPEWDYLMIYLTNQKAEVHDRLESCPTFESVKYSQGEIKALNDLLTLKKTVNTISDMAPRLNPETRASR